MKQAVLTRAYIGLGANLDDPPAQIRGALNLIAKSEAVQLLTQSSLYRSAPLVAEAYPQGQDDYCNAVAVIDTKLSAIDLLAAMQVIEGAMGRARPSARWGPRCIDLDLLLYGDAVISQSGLNVPHPEMSKRNFVLVPLTEVEPDIDIPGFGNAQALAKTIGMDGLELWEQSA